MAESENKGSIIPALIMLTMFLGIVMFLIYIVINYNHGTDCKIKAWFDEDKYCIDVANISYDHEWQMRSHEQDKINREKAEQKKIKLQETFDKKTACYEAGYEVNKSFDLLEDYGLSCKKIAYINDHLIDNFEKKDAGYIKGSYSGILSHGSVSGKMYQYVNDRILATGQLVENIYYHTDCENSTNKWFIENNFWDGKKLNKKDTTKIDYFTEEEFVMEYVERCLV